MQPQPDVTRPARASPFSIIPIFIFNALVSDSGPRGGTPAAGKECPAARRRRWDGRGGPFQDEAGDPGAVEGGETVPGGLPERRGREGRPGAAGDSDRRLAGLPK